MRDNKIIVWSVNGQCDEIMKDKKLETLLFSERLKFINTLRDNMQFRNDVRYLLSPINEDGLKSTIDNFTHRIIELENTVNSFKMSDEAWDKEKEFLGWCDDKRYKEIVERLDKLEKTTETNKADIHNVENFNTKLFNIIGERLDRLEQKLFAPQNDTYVRSDMVNSGQTKTISAKNNTLKPIELLEELKESEKLDVLNSNIKVPPLGTPIFTEEFLTTIPIETYMKHLQGKDEIIEKQRLKIKELEDRIVSFNKLYNELKDWSKRCKY
jgi:hypothetical protein